MPAKQFDETHFYTWNSFAPRLGVVYDLAGDGRMVVKGNYGLYWHNPGAVIGANANPNTANKSATYTWVDGNGDRRWQSGEETVRTAAALDGNLTIDPNIKDPYTHEASVWFEQQLTSTMGARAGFVYKTEDDLIATFQPGRPPSAFTVPYAFNDNGIDGRAGTADDRTLTFYGIPNSQAAQFPITETQMNVDQYSRYKTFEVSMNKRYSSRWSASGGFGYTWMSDFPNGPQRNANNPGVEDRTMWTFKMSGSYDAPFGIRISPVLRHQAGANYARTVTISAPAALNLTATSNGAAGTVAYVEPMNANREDNIWVFDVRVEKSLALGPRVRVKGFLDAFNLTDSHASETIGRATGLSYLKPTAILAPFTTRVGFRLIF